MAGSHRAISRAAADTFGTPTVRGATPAEGSTAAGSNTGNTASGLAAAVRDGDRALQMLQEYKELSELDKAVKSRMMQLLHNAVPGCKGASQAQSSAAAVDVPAVPVHAATAAPGRVQAADAPAASAGCVLAAQHVPATGQEATEGIVMVPASYSASTTASMRVSAEARAQQTLQGIGASTGAEALGVSDVSAMPHAATDARSGAGVLQATAGHAAQSRAVGTGHTAVAPRLQASGSATGASGTADVPAQSARASGDQTHTAQASMQHKDSPAKVQHSTQSDQGQKLAGLHRSPGLKSASTSYTSTQAGGGAMPAPAGEHCADPSTTAWAAHAHDAHAAKRTATRQLWQPEHAISAAAVPDKGPGLVSGALGTAVGFSSAKDAHPAAQMLNAPGVPVAGAQGSKASSVAALVAAVAGRSAKS